MDNELLEVQQVTSGRLKGIQLSILSDDDAVSGQSCIFYKYFMKHVENLTVLCIDILEKAISNGGWNSQ